jgi:hypothetical protein
VNEKRKDFNDKEQELMKEYRLKMEEGLREGPKDYIVNNIIL